MAEAVDLDIAETQAPLGQVTLHVEFLNSQATRDSETHMSIFYCVLATFQAFYKDVGSNIKTPPNLRRDLGKIFFECR